MLTDKTEMVDNLPEPPRPPQPRSDLSDRDRLFLHTVGRIGEHLVVNALISRDAFIKKRGDRRRDIAAECGHPSNQDIDNALLTSLYERNPIAARVVEVYPRECWEVQPTVYESEDIDTQTPFEKAWLELGTSFDEGDYFQDEKGSVIWNYLKQLDELSGIGRYGVMLLGIDDGKDLHLPATLNKDKSDSSSDSGSSSSDSTQPFYPQYPYNPSANNQTPPTVNKKQKLNYLRVFPESLAEVIQLESDQKNRRYGQPTSYRLTFSDPRNQEMGIRSASAQTATVHWTRIIHIADTHHTSSSNEWFAKPRMLPVLNRLLDLDKLYGGSAEMYWLGAFPGLILKAVSEEGIPPAISDPGLKAEIENYINGLQRFLRLANMEADQLSPTVVEPSPWIERQLEAICVKVRIPKRIFMGSERGELASSQDDATWNDHKKERQDGFITPRIIRPFVNRLIALNILPKPKGYSISWPDLSNQTATEKSNVAFKVAQSLSQYADSQAGMLITPIDFLVKVLGYTEQEAKKITENAEKAAKKAQKELEKQQQQQMAAQATDKDSWLKSIVGLKPPAAPGAPPGQPGSQPPPGASPAPGGPAGALPGGPPAKAGVAGAAQMKKKPPFPPR